VTAILLILAAFIIGGLFIVLLGSVWYLWAQRRVHKEIIGQLQLNNAGLNQKIVEYANMAQVYADRERAFMSKPHIATIRPEDAKEMAKIIAMAMQGKSIVPTC